MNLRRRGIREVANFKSRQRHWAACRQLGEHHSQTGRGIPHPVEEYPTTHHQPTDTERDAELARLSAAAKVHQQATQSRDRALQGQQPRESCVFDDGQELRVISLDECGTRSRRSRTQQIRNLTHAPRDHSVTSIVRGEIASNPHTMAILIVPSMTATPGTRGRQGCC